MTISNRQSFRNVPLLFYHWIGERTTPPVLDCVILEHWSTQKAVPNRTSVTNKYQYYTANCFLQQLHFEFSEYWSLLRRDIPTSRARRAVPVLPWARTNSVKAGDHWISVTIVTVHLTGFAYKKLSLTRYHDICPVDHSYISVPGGVEKTSLCILVHRTLMLLRVSNDQTLTYFLSERPAQSATHFLLFRSGSKKVFYYLDTHIWDIPADIWFHALTETLTEVRRSKSADTPPSQSRIRWLSLPRFR